MKRALTAALLASVSVLAAACEPEPEPMIAFVSFASCVGRHLTCSDNCCASQEEQIIGESAIVDCRVTPGSADSYNLDIGVESGSSGPAIWGDDLGFFNNPSSPASVRTCGGFTVRAHDNNRYSSESCAALDVREDGGGGCEVEVHVNAADVVVGRFRCKELQLPPSQDIYFSSVFNGTVGWGEFRIENCAIRL